METMSRIVKRYRDRIQRGGGSVVVSAAGAVELTPVAGSYAVITGNRVTTPILFVRNSNSDAAQALAVRNAADNASAFTVTGSGNVTATGTLTVSGTGINSFSGPVKVTGTGANIATAFQANVTDAVATVLYSQYRNGDRRFSMVLDTNNDTYFAAVTGAGFGASTEALRIVNANGYVSVPTRLGLATATPGYLYDFNGSGKLNGSVGVGGNPDSATARLYVYAPALPTVSAARFDGIANATAPVLVVKGGTTPGVGGDLAQYRDVLDFVCLRVGSGGALTLENGSRFIGLAQRGSNAPVAAVGAANLWYDDTAKAFKYIDSAGTIKTITAA